jgi:hypothetical protein
MFVAKRTLGALLQGEELSARQAHGGVVPTDFALDLNSFELDSIDALARPDVDSQHATGG